MSRRTVTRYAKRWLNWYPESTEAQLREALTQRFLKSSTDGEIVSGAVAGMTSHSETNPADLMAGGCLGLILIGPLAVLWRRLFPVDRQQMARDIEDVLSELRDAGRWQSS